jgi:hypothetical protein
MGGIVRNASDTFRYFTAWCIHRDLKTLDYPQENMNMLLGKFWAESGTIFREQSMIPLLLNWECPRASNDQGLNR